MKRNPLKKYRNKIQKNWKLGENELIDLLDEMFDKDKNPLYEQVSIIDFFIRYMEIVKPQFRKEMSIDIPGLELQKNSKQDLSDYDEKFIEVLSWLLKKKVAVLKEFHLNISIVLYEIKEWVDKEYRISYIQHLIQEIEPILGNEKNQDGSDNPYYEINEQFRLGQYPEVFSTDANNLSIVEATIAFKAYLKGELNSIQEPVLQDQIVVQGEIKGEKDKEGSLVVTIPMEKIKDEIINRVNKAKISIKEPSPVGKLSLFTPNEVCKMLKITPQTLNNWVKQGRIQAYRLGEKPVRYKREDIEKLLVRMNIIPVND